MAAPKGRVAERQGFGRLRDLNVTTRDVAVAHHLRPLLSRARPDSLRRGRRRFILFLHIGSVQLDVAKRRSIGDLVGLVTTDLPIWSRVTAVLHSDWSVCIALGLGSIALEADLLSIATFPAIVAPARSRCSGSDGPGAEAF